MNLLIKTIFLFSIMSSAWAYNHELFGKLAHINNIDVSDEGRCLAKRSEIIKSLYQIESKQVLDEKLKQQVDCLSLLKNFKHDKKYRNVLPSWEEMIRLPREGSKTIQGSIFYMGFAPQKFRYDMAPNAVGGFDITVKIYVKQWKIWKGSKLMQWPEQERLDHLKRLYDLILTHAQEIWNTNDRGLRFFFKRVENKSEAHYRIRLVQSLMPLKYNSKWTWWPTDNINAMDFMITGSFEFQSALESFSHEIGHMMGLEDEYNLPKTMLALPAAKIEEYLHPGRKYDNLQVDKWARGCDQTSIMCKDPAETLIVNDYHYYLITRRYFK